MRLPHVVFERQLFRMGHLHLPASHFPHLHLLLDLQEAMMCAETPNVTPGFTQLHEDSLVATLLFFCVLFINGVDRLHTSEERKRENPKAICFNLLKNLI